MRTRASCWALIKESFKKELIKVQQADLEKQSNRIRYPLDGERALTCIKHYTERQRNKNND